MSPSVEIRARIADACELIAAGRHYRTGDLPCDVVDELVGRLLDLECDLEAVERRPVRRLAQPIDFGRSPSPAERARILAHLREHLSRYTPQGGLRRAA